MDPQKRSARYAVVQALPSRVMRPRTICDGLRWSGVKRNVRAAVRWFRSAARPVERGPERSRACLHEGTGVLKNRERSMVPRGEGWRSGPGSISGSVTRTVTESSEAQRGRSLLTKAARRGHERAGDLKEHRR
jgi:TPR repeat protein